MGSPGLPAGVPIGVTSGLVDDTFDDLLAANRRYARSAPREFDGSEGCRVPHHHFIPIPIGSALTISASACWQ